MGRDWAGGAWNGGRMTQRQTERANNASSQAASELWWASWLVVEGQAPETGALLTVDIDCRASEVDVV